MPEVWKKAKCVCGTLKIRRSAVTWRYNVLQHPEDTTFCSTLKIQCSVLHKTSSTAVLNPYVLGSDPLCWLQLYTLYCRLFCNWKLHAINKTLFYYSNWCTQLKNHRMLKPIKIPIIAPTCFGSRRNHQQGAISCLPKTTIMILCARR